MRTIWENLKKSPWGPSTTFFSVLTLMVYVLQNHSSNPDIKQPRTAGEEGVSIAKRALELDWTWVPIVTGILALGWGLFWFTHAFTGTPKDKRPEQVKFSYFFVLASFAVLFLPPLVKDRAIGSETMGIILGCVKYPDSSALSCTPAVDKQPSERTVPVSQPPGASPAPANDQPSGSNVAGNKPPGASTVQANNQWLVNIGGALAPQVPCAGKDCTLGYRGHEAFITGGLVVPLPLLIIALFGAAISLSRRVPEIQKQSEPDYVSTAELPALTATEARERLAFQIMQFISAPLIAITAHQVFHPDTESAAIALAFLAGFGSETILLLIRGVAEGIKPKTADTAQAKRVGTVEGLIRADGKPVMKDVTVLGTSLTGKSDENGKYTIKGVPAGGQVLSVLNGKTFETHEVTVQAGASILCNFDIVRDETPAKPGLVPGITSTDTSAADEGAVTVNIRVAIDKPDPDPLLKPGPHLDLDPGTLKLFVDNEEIHIDDDGMVELSMEANALHRLRAIAMRNGAEVSAKLDVSVNLDDENRPFTLQLA